MRRFSKEVKIGNLIIGGNNSVKIQSMTNTDTADKESTAAQLKALEECGCDIARFTVNNRQAVSNIPYYKSITKMPLVADIHFDYKLAIESAFAGIDKIRINPGNIGSVDRVKEVCRVCHQKNIPIRIGINGGSLDKEILAKHGKPTAEAIAESTINSVKLLESFDFDNIVLSIKSSDVPTVIKANRIIAEQCVYPLHIGVTEPGLLYAGSIKSAIGIGSLLNDGIGDTIRVSLTDDPVSEILAAKEILKALGLIKGITLVCCPTCGRTKIDLIKHAEELEKELKKLQTEKSIKVALMGCAVNGPGEAREADIGVAAGNGVGVLFKNGEIICKINENEIVIRLIEEVKKLL